MINNLLPNEIELFYNFLYYYENHIKKYSTNKSLGSLSAQFKETTNNQSINVKKTSKTEIDSQSLQSNNVFVTGNESVMLCFARHLRNSIAHCLVEKKGTDFYLKDYSGIHLSMIGELAKDSLLAIIELFINHFKPAQ